MIYICFPEKSNLNQSRKMVLKKITIKGENIKRKFLYFLSKILEKEKREKSRIITNQKRELDKTKNSKKRKKIKAKKII
jgi:hypothetical protein